MIHQVFNPRPPTPMQICIVEQLLQMGVMEGVFDSEWRVKEDSLEKHLIPAIKNEALKPFDAVRI